MHASFRWIYVLCMAHEFVLDLEHVLDIWVNCKPICLLMWMCCEETSQLILDKWSKVFPDFFAPSHCLFLFATQHQKSASCTGFQCSFQIIQCRSQLNLQWFSCEQMGHPKGRPFQPVNPIKSQEINSDLEAFLWTFQQKFLGAGFFGNGQVGDSEKCSTPNGSCNPFAHHYCWGKSGDQPSS